MWLGGHLFTVYNDLYIEYDDTMDTSLVKMNIPYMMRFSETGGDNEDR